MSVGENLKKLREANHMTKKDAAEKMGLPYTTYNNYETNARDVGSFLLIKFAKFYGVTVDYLLDNKIHAQQDDFIDRFSEISIKNGGKIIGAEMIPREWEVLNQQFIGFIVTDESMYPKYMIGDVVITRLQDTFQSGQDVVLEIDGIGPIVRTVEIVDDGKYKMIPRNPEYPAKTVKRERVKIIGVVKRIRRDLDV